MHSDPCTVHLYLPFFNDFLTIFVSAVFRAESVEYSGLGEGTLPHVSQPTDKPAQCKKYAASILLTSLALIFFYYYKAGNSHRVIFRREVLHNISQVQFSWIVN